MSGIFHEWAPRFWAKGHSAIPVVVETKRPAVSNWSGFSFNLPKPETRANWLSTYALCSLGICLGTPLSEAHVLFAVDVDDDLWVKPVRALLGNCPCAKRGKKGQTIFVRAPMADRMKSTVIADHEKRQVVDILGPKKQTILPPSLHPDTRAEYQWIGKSLLEISTSDELPEFGGTDLQALKMLIRSEEAVGIIGGEATHDASLRLSAKLVRVGLSDDRITAIFESLLPDDYDGDSLEELPELIASARQKGFGEIAQRTSSDPYVAGAIGPLPLGYAGNEFVFRHQQTREVVRRSGVQLIMPSGLFELASMTFWVSQFPKRNQKGDVYGIDYISAGNALIQACRAVGGYRY
jgi:Bifunctional DNA primase/polymerase, N-terminal